MAETKWESGGRLGVTNVDRHGWTVIVQSNREQVALVRHEHDVPLVLAAPDLYEEAERALAWLRDRFGHAGAPFDQGAHDRINGLANVLALARGEEG